MTAPLPILTNLLPPEELEKRFNPREPRDPATGQWMNLGGVTSDASRLAHTYVGNTMARSSRPPGYSIGKKITRGEPLTRKERSIAKTHVARELGAKGNQALGSTAYIRYRDFAKVHGMNFKGKPHPKKGSGDGGGGKVDSKLHATAKAKKEVTGIFAQLKSDAAEEAKKAAAERG